MQKGLPLWGAWVEHQHGLVDSLQQFDSKSKRLQQSLATFPASLPYRQGAVS